MCPTATISWRNVFTNYQGHREKEIRFFINKFAIPAGIFVTHTQWDSSTGRKHVPTLEILTISMEFYIFHPLEENSGKFIFARFSPRRQLFLSSSLSSRHLDPRSSSICVAFALEAFFSLNSNHEYSMAFLLSKSWIKSQKHRNEICEIYRRLEINCRRIMNRRLGFSRAMVVNCPRNFRSSSTHTVIYHFAVWHFICI